MTTGFKSGSGVDIATLFQAGNAGLSTGLKVAGVDIGTLFAAYAAGTKIVTGLRNSALVDIGQLFNPIAAQLTCSFAPQFVQANSFYTGGTCSLLTTAQISGGTGPYTEAWTLLSNPGGVTLDAGTTTAQITKAYNRYQTYDAQAILQLEVTDSASHTATYQATISLIVNGSKPQ